MRIGVIAVTLFLFVLIILSGTGLAAYRSSLEIPVKGRTYLLFVNATVEKIGNYGFATIYLRPQGVYAYGVIIMKDPDEQYPHVYLMAGNQNNWYDMGYLKNNRLIFTLVFDTEGKILGLNLTGNTRIINTTYSPLIKSVYIAAANISGRDKDYPVLNIYRLNVYVSNASLPVDLLKNITVENLASKLNMTLSINITNNKTISPSTMTSSPSGSGVPPILSGLQNTMIYVLIAAAGIIVAAVAIILSLKSGRRSPGP